MPSPPCSCVTEYPATRHRQPQRLHEYINQGRAEADRPAVSPRRLTSYLLTHPDPRSQRQQEIFEILNDRLL
ncbi:hypothetical protein GCM10010109_32630 [Actinoplanes campanulatus]|nr:hypothetical protein GCM10010109_32630 [Actinoplanes campanulatus]GID41601.1 hypothetical protein Aca09nite_81070 [Actinoplanes campanulatus]